jgi:hypothetical protein
LFCSCSKAPQLGQVNRARRPQSTQRNWKPCSVVSVMKPGTPRSTRSVPPPLGPEKVIFPILPQLGQDAVSVHWSRLVIVLTHIAASVGGLFHVRTNLRCRVLAHNGLSHCVSRCPFIGAKQKYRELAATSVFDPERTHAAAPPRARDPTGPMLQKRQKFLARPPSRGEVFVTAGRGLWSF